MWRWRNETLCVNPLPLALEGNKLLAVSTHYCTENPMRAYGVFPKWRLVMFVCLGCSSFRGEVRETMKLIDPAVEARKIAVRRRGKYVSKGPYHV